MAASTNPIPPALRSPVEQIFLYDEPDALGLDIGFLARYLISVLPSAEAHVRRDFLTHHLEPYAPEQREALGQALLAQFHRARVLTNSPLEAEPEVESCGGEEPDETVIEEEAFYDGKLVQELFSVLLPPPETNPEDLHLVFTNLRLAVRSSQDDLYQAILVFGNLTLISLPGVVEALAPPRKYDFLRAQMAMLGLEEGLDELEEQFAPLLLGPGDPRLGEVLKGFVLQALFSRLWGEAFCPDPDCRLFNAETYEDLFHAQTRAGAGLCAGHRAWLRPLNAAPERA